jgi:phage-related minor tail protein
MSSYTVINMTKQIFKTIQAVVSLTMLVCILAYGVTELIATVGVILICLASLLDAAVWLYDRKRGGAK